MQDRELRRSGHPSTVAGRSDRSLKTPAPLCTFLTPQVTKVHTGFKVAPSDGRSRRDRPQIAFVVTDPTRRRYGLATLVGLIAGIDGVFIKLGWEVPFPPRTPDRNLTNPPQELAQQLGFSPDFTHATVTFNGNKVEYISLFMHFGFSIFFAIAYCVIAEKYPQIKIWQGVGFGPLHLVRLARRDHARPSAPFPRPGTSPGRNGSPRSPATRPGCG